MSRPGDEENERGGQLIPFPRRPATAGDVHETELADLDDGPGGPGEAGDSSATSSTPGTDLEIARPVLDAELVDDDQPAGGGLVRRPVVVVRQLVTPVVVVVQTVRQHQPTVRASKAAGRQLVFVFTGAGVLAVRVWNARTNSRYERQMRAAEAAGDQDGLRYWQEQGEQAKERRHKRRMEALALPWRLTKALVVTLPVAAVLLLLIGLAVGINQGDLSLVLDPLLGTVSAIGWLAGTLIWLAGMLAIIAPFLLVGTLWWIGRRADNTPRWLANPVPDDAGDVMDGLPDETMIVQALRNTVPALDKAIKAGWRMHYEMPPMKDGKGWRAQLALPPAAPVVEFVKRKPMLAHNLRRFPNEVWPTEPKAAVLDLWVAKPGALSGPVEPWPLLKDLDNSRVDYFAGVPVGVTIKGDVIRGRLFEANWVAGGMMGSGKSTLIITALLGAMLDPLVDIDVVVMADNADYDPMKPRLNRLVTGVGEDTVERCMAMLYELFEDCSVRGQALREHDERFVTREIAEKDSRLRPRIMVIDECQNLFIGAFGKDAIEITTKVMSTARKYAITLMFLTPEPSKDALPRKLISIASNKACYAIGDHQGNDAVLGSGSYKAGISAVGLTPKTDDGPGDVGTCMQRGFTGTPGLMRGFYITQSDAHRVTQRATQLRERRQITAAPAAEARDLLADVAEVIGAGPNLVRAADVPALLANAFPRGPYQRLTGKELVAQLGELGVKVPSTGNRWPIHPSTVREALDRRS